MHLFRSMGQKLNMNLKKLHWRGGILAWDSVLLGGQIIPTLEMTLAYLLRRLYQEVLQQRMADSGSMIVSCG
uniref:Alternative protein DLG2 n=1 Tax=Homo sapiens TaxID=9606 RepID=L8E8R0_HUMAN|nr:alternative protein DLG2 [Homo sapiens]